jgi:ligand-binding sensor domain-containing protein/signal transduction histidine kinase/CheY-like chemotaxis protein
VSTPSLALEPGRRLSQYNHENWRSEDGLPQNSVLCSAQTPDGYWWFGTYEGLARFDGARFTVFNQQTSPELGDQEILALAVDATGVLWVGTSQGLLRYEEGQLRRPPEAAELAELRITGLVADGKAVWIGSARGVTRAPISSKAPWRHYTEGDGLPVAGMGPMAADGSGGLWVGTARGLARVSGDKVERLSLPPGSSPQVKSLWLARDGTLWIGTSKGLLSFREGQFTRFGREQQLPEAGVWELLEDRDGNLWVVTGKGMFRRTTAGFSAVSSPKVLSVNPVLSLFEDRSGHLWIGTPNEGVHRLSNGPFIPLGEPEGASDSSPSLVLETRDGTLWMVSMNEGLERVKDGVFSRVGAAEGLPSQHVRTLAEGSDGTLWVGMPSGAFRQEGERFVPLGPEQGMPANASIWAMAPEPGGMWFATSEGLARLQDGRVTVYGPEQGFVFEPIMVMLREDSGTIWYGTHAGLVRFAHGTFTRFTTEQGLAGDSVFSLYADARGTLWIGTKTGLSRLKDGRITSLTAEQGLPEETVFNLLLDSEGFFWMSSNKGVSRVSLRELDEVADGRRSRVNGILFDERDGMRVGECNGGFQPSAWKTQDGRMWFANLRGAVMVNPKDARLRPPPPQVRLEEVRVQGQPVPPAGKRVVPPGQTDLEFRFTALGTEGAARVRFRYRLEGYDAGWVDAEERRVASYMRLPPGSYRFQVQALNRQGSWVEPGAGVEVTLQPWFHQTAWFYLLCALAVGGVAVSVYVWRVGRLKQRERWLHARVDERTKELARANSELDAHLRALRATQAQLVQAGKMAAVGTLAAGVGHEINNPLSYIISNLEHSCEELEEVTRMAESSEPVRERLREVQQVLREALMGSDRVRRIVRDLKTFSRQDEDTRGPVELREVMDSAAKMAAGELKPRAQLVRDYEAGVPPVEGNEARLAQVFLNLIINAAQALPEGKPEQNEVRLVLRRGEADSVVAEVRDTGSGIPPEVLGRIFDPFFTTKPVGVGTGLGLALCQAFIASMGGRIEVESQVGQGTVFRVTLPAAKEKLERASRLTPARAGGSARGRVLVVDDDPLVSSAVRRTLSRDHEVEVVVSSRRALELLTSPEGNYDVILCDLMMPELTGMDLHAELAVSSPERARRMVFITGGAYTQTAKDFLERVSNPRVEKPFDPEKLREQVGEWVKKVHARVADRAA